MSRKEYIYSDFTYNSKNPLARFSHRKRFSTAKSIVLNQGIDNLLDYGAGDLRFLEELYLSNRSIKLSAFEPVMKNLDSKHIIIHTKAEELAANKYSAITCFEVLEHFNHEEQIRILSLFDDLLDDNGLIIISVPIEVGFPSVVKNIRRLTQGNFNLVFILNSIKCFLGLNIPKLRNQSGFIFSHLGFNHHKLEKLFYNRFEIIKKINSPFIKMPELFNSQIFYVLTKKK